MGVLSLINGIHYAYNYEATIANTVDDTLRPELVQLHAELQKRSIRLAWVPFPTDAPDKTLGNMQAGLREGLRQLNDELHSLTASLGGRIDPKRLVKYAGALYLPPPEIELGAPWIPSDLVRAARQPF